jgi:hypothetical protein
MEEGPPQVEPIRGAASPAASFLSAAFADPASLGGHRPVTVRGLLSGFAGGPGRNMAMADPNGLLIQAMLSGLNLNLRQRHMVAAIFCVGFVAVITWIAQR